MFETHQPWEFALKHLLFTLVLLCFLGCTPKPSIYVITRSAIDSLAQMKAARLEAQPLVKVDLHYFKRAFVKRYGSEAAFLDGF